jgi:hypothetical protein
MWVKEVNAPVASSLATSGAVEVVYDDRSSAEKQPRRWTG